MWRFISPVALMIAWPALAEQRPPPSPPPDPIVQAVIADWAAATRTRDHTLESLQKFIDAYLKLQEERRALESEVEGWRAYARPLYATD